MSAKIVVVGSFNADLVTYLPRLPKPGETLSGKRFVTGPGGKGSNQAVAAARLGAQVTFIGRVGKDTLSEMAYSLWRQENIQTQHVRQDEVHSTGVAIILVEESGENVIVVTLGANLAISRSDIDLAAETIAHANVLMTQLEIDHEIAAYALQTARAKGVRTILNPAPAVKLPPQVTALADFITPNETELLIVAGEKDAGQAAAALLQSEQQTVVMTLGERGARWVNRTGSSIVPAYRVEAVDTVGAGDAFNAGLAVALAEGKTLPEAILFANAAAALCVTRHGAAASMPYRHEVETFITTRK
ncbi:MAG: ribokinase [Chloroflexi bacterium]|nr:ribokinase [Chloroflexota bacterium]